MPYQLCRRVGPDQTGDILSSESLIWDELQKEAPNRALIWGIGSMVESQSVEAPSRLTDPILSPKNDHFQAGVRWPSGSKA